LQRYSNIEFLYTLDLYTAMELISKAYKEKIKDRVFTLYANIYPNMDEDNFISFDEFYGIMTVDNKRDKDEILDEVKQLLNFEWKEVM
jgi:hypothetical protein